jgi:hypothetical protein
MLRDLSYKYHNHTQKGQMGEEKKYYLLEYMSSNESFSSTIGIELTLAANRKTYSHRYRDFNKTVATTTN